MSITKTKQRKKKRKKMKRQQVDILQEVKPLAISTKNTYEMKSFSYTLFT